MRKRRLIAAVIIPVILILLVSHCSKEKIALDDIMGLWRTDAQEYADRSFEITKDRIAFGIGEGKFKNYSIKKIHVKQSTQDKSRLYTIYYEDSDGEGYTFAFYYYHENGGTIRLKNQKQMEWKKELVKR
jgi:hypothetical protein